MNRLKNYGSTGLLCAVALMAALFCALFTTQTEVSAQAAPATMNITIQGFAFSPNTLTIPVGTKVIWTNKDSVSHTVTSDSGGTLSSALIPQNTTFEFTFTTAGTYSYHCTPHPNMKANIIVTAAASTPVQAPATGSGGINNSNTQNPWLWLIILSVLSLTSLTVVVVRRRAHR